MSKEYVHGPVDAAQRWEEINRAFNHLGQRGALYEAYIIERAKEGDVKALAVINEVNKLTKALTP